MHPNHPLRLVRKLSDGWQTLRWLPFLAAAFASICIAFVVAPGGRKPFDIDWSLSVAAIRWSLAKGPHVGAAALIALVAVIATGRQRLGLAFGLTVLVGGGWELGQTTVAGHQARWSDLAPDALGAAAGCAWGATLLWLLEPQRLVCTPLRRAGAPARKPGSLGSRRFRSKDSTTGRAATRPEPP